MTSTVGSIMSKDVAYVEPEEPLTRALDLMIAMRARSFPVLEPGHKLVGMISRTDLTVRFMLRRTHNNPSARVQHNAHYPSP